MERLLATIIEVVLPLRSLASAESVRGFLEELGYLLPEDTLPPASPIDFRASLAGGLELAARLQTAEERDVRVAALEEAQSLVRSVWSGASALHSTLTSGLETIPQFLSKTGFRDNFRKRLLDYLLVTYVRETAPRTHSLLEVAGLIASVAQSKNVARFESECTLHTLHFERFATLIRSPRSLANELYAWETNFDSDTFLERLSHVMASYGLAGNLLPDDIPSTDPAQPTSGPRQLFMPLVSGGRWPESFWQLGLRVEAAARSGNQKKGLAIIPYAHGTLAASVALSENLQLGLSLGTSVDRGIGLYLRPPASVRVEKNLFTQPAASTDTQLSLELTYSNPAEALVLLGSASATRLTAKEVSLEAGVDGDDLYLELGLPEWSLVVDPGEGDSFVAEALGALPLNVGGALTLGFASSRGFYIESAAELCLVVPIDKSLGPLYLAEAELRLGLAAQAIALETTLTGNLTLGPFVLTLERVGLRSALEWAAADGLLGDFDVYFAFKPPTGIGLAVRAGPISGGGFLSVDTDKGEYAGAAELEMLGVGITAVGLIATRLPDGGDGWSMFLSLALHLPNLQLGFGFTLNGVGGLIGVNRGLDADALGAGVRSGALDAILFPADPIADAPRILADIGSIFPAAPGQFTFGPIVAIGWGTPTLVSLELGVVVQLPEPLTISLLGSLEARLPTREQAILELRVDVAGTANLTEGTLKIDASLRDSRVLTFALTGDMAIRASFLDNPTFLIAFGGFHPDFDPPADFPELDRLAIALDTGDALRVRLGGYFALTSNTLQFGADASLWVKAAGITAEGGTSFDALIYFAPFGFVVGLRVWISIKAGRTDLLGVELTGTLRGPNPWRVAGSASFKLLGIKQSLEIEATVGGRRADAPSEVVFVEALLIDALRRADAWSALPPSGDGDPVLLGELESDAHMLHPAGRIEVRQRVVPLGIRIEHYGNAKLGDTDTFELAGATIGEIPVATQALEDLQEHFAAAQFFSLSEEERLSAPSFEPLKAGLRFGDARAGAGRAAEFTFDHELVYRDPNVRGANAVPTGTLFTATQTAVTRAVALSAALAARNVNRLPSGIQSQSSFALRDAAYVALETDTAMLASELTPAAGTGFFAAREAVRTADDPQRAVVPAYVLELVR